MPGGVEGKLENQKQANGLKNSMSSFYEYCQCFRFWRRKKDLQGGGGVFVCGIVGSEMLENGTWEIWKADKEVEELSVPIEENGKDYVGQQSDKIR